MTPAKTVVYSRPAGGLRLRSDLPSTLIMRADAVIFDIDGVLVEVRDSFREVISLALQHYFKEVLGVPGETRLVGPDETALFKLAGRYNNDWDLAQGAAAWGLLKLTAGGGDKRNIESLRESSPTLEEFTARIGREGGGLDNTMRLVRRELDPEQKAAFDRLYRPELIKRIFQEYYAGPALCREFYGFEPEHYKGRGLVENESPIVDPALVGELAGFGMVFGVLSGRTVEEADYVLERLGIERYLHPRGKVVDDGTVPPKPDPDGLIELARRTAFTSALYVGDVPDDWTTVKAYAEALPQGPPVLGCMVATGADPNGRVTEHFERSGVHCLAADVNVLLNFLLELKSGKSTPGGMR